jgi:predicted kinase
MPKLYVLVGPPGVGKSSWIAQNVANPHIISYDSAIDIVREPLGLRYNDVAGGQKQFRKEVEAVHKQMIRDSVGSGKDIVVDMTNMTAKARRRALAAVSGHEREYEKVAVVFDFQGAERGVHDAVAQRAARLGDKTLSYSIVQGMMDRFEMPSEGEGFDKIVVVRPEHIREVRRANRSATSVNEAHLRLLVRKVLLDAGYAAISDT